ncbi:MAG: DUF3352 domain-containing protein [Leptolyngbya sp. BL-A-14]
MIKKKKPSLLLPIGAAVLLIGGGGAAYWALTKGGIGSGDLPVGAEVIPQDALMTLSVSTDPAQWEQLREFGTSQSQAAFDQNLAQLRDRFLTANGYDYQKDIQPWIGKEVSIALLAPPAATTAPNATPVLPKPVAIVVMPIQNPLQAKQLLDKPRSQAAGKLVDRTYKGFQIKETQGKENNFSATVFDGKLLVVATDPKAMDRAIDTYKGEQGQLALKATPGFTQALGKIQATPSFGRMYLNFPAATAFTVANSGKAATAPNAAQMSQTQGVAATMSLEPEGVHFRGVTWYKPDSQKTYKVENNGKSMPGRLPQSTLLMASGGNLKQFWQNYTQGATAINLALPPVSPDWLQKALQSTINMDLDKDFLAWMDGEFALAMVGVPDGSPSGLPFNLLFMVKSSDRRATEATLKQLDQTMADKYKFKVEEVKAGDQPTTNWSSPLGFAVTHGWLNDDVAFIALGSPSVPVVNDILPKPATSLADSQPFKTSVPSEPNPNNGNFFANLDLYKTKKLPLPQLPLGNQNLLDAIRSIGVTAAISDDRSTRYDVSLLLQKAGKPAPLPSPTVPSTLPSQGGNPALEIPSAPSPLPSP